MLVMLACWCVCVGGPSKLQFCCLRTVYVNCVKINCLLNYGVYIDYWDKL